MKSLHELIDRNDPGWPLVEQWVSEATNPVEVLPPPDDATRQRALLDMQVTTRSPVGAIIYESGGIFVDHAWLRILGSGHPRLPRSLPGWSLKRSFSSSGGPPPFLLIADDIVGGFFAVDGGGLGLERGRSATLLPTRSPGRALAWVTRSSSFGVFVATSPNITRTCAGPVGRTKRVRFPATKR